MINPFPEGLERTLFKLADKNKWEEVIQTYETNPEAHTARITSSGDTALHIAISKGEEAAVEKLVAVVRQAGGALEMRNELGNTPLHLAAYLGNAEMCRSIAGCDSKLMGLRNGDEETPFFLAVRYGRKEAFYAMHRICRPGEGYNYCRGKDGETILHSAISGEYFDLASYIMNHYQKLLNAITEQGFSALHILANKPSVFRSGSQIRGLDKLIYHCISVDELDLQTEPYQYLGLRYEKSTAKYPENYHTCAQIFKILMNVPRILCWLRVTDGGSLMAAGHCSVKKEYDEEKQVVTDLSESEEGEQFQYVEAQIEQENRLRYRKVPDLYPENYKTFFDIAKLIFKVMLVILGFGSEKLERVRKEKEKHIWSLYIMEELLKNAECYEYENNGKKPVVKTHGNGYFISTVAAIQEVNEPCREMEKEETPILMAAKNGVVEMVAEILNSFPMAVHDTNYEKKNIVLLAVENRRLSVYEFLRHWNIMGYAIFRNTDRDGNSALHLAARLSKYRPWLTPGIVLQMQMEIKWYEFVEKSMPPHFFPRYNNESQTAKQIFSETHERLAAEDSKWLINTSQSSSVVAALVATVAFTTSATVPGGLNSDSGAPTLQNHPAFTMFAVTSLLALCLSVTSVVLFLSILTSRNQEKEFHKKLPWKLLAGLTSLLISIASMMLSFCASHFLVLRERFQYASLIMYVITCLPLAFFAIVQFPQYFDLVRATFNKLPEFPSNYSDE